MFPSKSRTLDASDQTLVEDLVHQVEGHVKLFEPSPVLNLTSDKVVSVPSASLPLQLDFAVTQLPDTPTGLACFLAEAHHQGRSRSLVQLSLSV